MILFYIIFISLKAYIYWFSFQLDFHCWHPNNIWRFGCVPTKTLIEGVCQDFFKLRHGMSFGYLTLLKKTNSFLTQYKLIWKISWMKIEKLTHLAKKKEKLIYKSYTIQHNKHISSKIRKEEVNKKLLGFHFTISHFRFFAPTFFFFFFVHLG